jgi:membrane-anchored glycerophosphoryl diester phosphodiesterase (GDPDase)
MSEPQRINITSVLLGTSAEMQNRGPALVRSALLPAILIVTTTQLDRYFEFGLIMSAIVSLSILVWTTLYMVPVMRCVLIGESAIGRKWGLRWGWAETRFLLRCLILYAVPIVIIMVLMFLAYWLIPPAYRDSFTNHWSMQLLAVTNMILMLYVLARLSLMLPAAAIGDTANPKQAWRLSYRNGWRLFGLYVLLTLVLGILNWFISLPLLLFDHPVVSWGIGVVGTLFAVVGVVAIAIVYRELSSMTETGETMEKSPDSVDSVSQ